MPLYRKSRARESISLDTSADNTKQKEPSAKQNDDVFAKPMDPPQHKNHFEQESRQTAEKNVSIATIIFKIEIYVNFQERKLFDAYMNK